MSALGHVWTAPWQELLTRLQDCSGRVSGLFVRRVRPPALISARIGSQSKTRTLKCADPNGFSRSPERPYLHYVVMPSPIPSNFKRRLFAGPHLGMGSGERENKVMLWSIRSCAIEARMTSTAPIPIAALGALNRWPKNSSPPRSKTVPTRNTIATKKSRIMSCMCKPLMANVSQLIRGEHLADTHWGCRARGTKFSARRRDLIIPRAATGPNYSVTS